MDLQQLARLVSDKTGIPWGPRSVERALAAVFVSDSLWEIAHKSDEPLPAVSTLVGLLLEEGMLRASSEGIFLTEDGKAFVKEQESLLLKITPAQVAGKALAWINSKEPWSAFMRFSAIGRRRYPI